MTRIVVDENLVAQLGKLPGPVEICDASGHILGRFLPQASPTSRLDDQCPYSADELAARYERASGGGKKLSQMLKDLGIDP